MTTKQPMSFRPTPDDVKVINALKKKLGVDFAQLVRLGLRKLAEAA